MRPGPSLNVVARLAEIPAEEQCTTAVTIGEPAIHLLTSTRILPFDGQAAERHGRIRSELERKGTRLADPDLRIAATALACGATLISGNIRHFARVSDLAVENWLRA